MSHKKKFTFFLLLFAGSAAGLWFSGIWISRFHADARYRIPETVTMPTSGAAGERLAVTAKIVTPRADEITSVKVFPGKGSVAGKVVISRKTRWLNAENRLSFPLLLLRSGEITAGKVEVQFARGRKSVIAIPQLAATFEAPKNAQTPQLAGDLTEKQRTVWHWYVLGGGLLLIAVGAGYFISRRRREFAENFYETILAEIEKIPANSITPESGVARLTDLVRRYLDFRYDCAVESASTVEFLRQLEKADSPLPAEIHPFLREFLRDADLVKFANAGADHEKLAAASRRAADLVRTTMPHEKEEKRV